MNKLKVMSVFGTRPEAIKMAPLVKALQASEQIESVVCLTGQHREMLDSVMQIFRLTGDYDLHIMEKRQTLSTITTKTLLGMDEVLDTVKPDLVLVHGDTSTTFAGALAAFYHQVKVGHVEAGLRTWDKYSPFPEEMNRTLVGDIADLHFSPTRANAENLRREAIMGDIFITGNTAIDAMRYTVKPDFVFPTQLLNELDFQSRRVIAVTCHRRENYGKPMEDIMHAILRVVESHPDVEVVYPVHLSPVVRECVFPILGGHDRIHLIDPVDVEEMHNLIARCYMVMTDSGGLQEEGRPSLPGPRSSRASTRMRSSGWQASCWTIRPPTRAWRRPSTPTATATRASGSCRPSCGTSAVRRKSPQISTPEQDFFGKPERKVTDDGAEPEKHAPYDAVCTCDAGRHRCDRGAVHRQLPPEPARLHRAA